MQIETFAVAGPKLITPQVFEDERGFFLERYNRQLFLDQGIDLDFVQDNHSQSTRGILRGLHYQLPPFAQTKLIWVTRGEVFDVAVDIRTASPTFGRWVGAVLSEANKQMMLIPAGFAHGFAVLSDVADFQYKVTAYYSKAHDRGILWNDPALAIEWPLADPLLSAKDQEQPTLAEAQNQGELF